MENSKISPEACYSIVLQASVPITPEDLEFKTIETTNTKRNLSQLEICNLNRQKGVEAYRFGKKIKKSDIEGIYFPHEEAILSLPEYLKAVKKILKTGIDPKDCDTKEAYVWRLNNVKKSLSSIFSDYKPRLGKTIYPDSIKEMEKALKEVKTDEDVSLLFGNATTSEKVTDEIEGIVMGKSPEDSAGMN